MSAPRLILVAGGECSGRRSFARAYRHSFLLDLPFRKLGEGISSRSSFAAIISLDERDDRTRELLRKAKELGYRITMYYLFTGSSLALLRGHSLSVVERKPFDPEAIKESYRHTYKGLALALPCLSLVFLVTNFKKTRIRAVLEPGETMEEDMLEAIVSLKREAEGLGPLPFSLDLVE